MNIVKNTNKSVYKITARKSGNVNISDEILIEYYINQIDAMNQLCLYESKQYKCDNITIIKSSDMYDRDILSAFVYKTLIGHKSEINW